MTLGVSVVVVTWNGLDLTLRCLESLRSQRTEGLDVELVVVDNGSTDGTAGVIGAMPDVTLVPLATNTGFAGGVNAGIRATRRPVVVLINNDATAEPDFLAQLVGPLDADRSGRLGATTGRVVLSGLFRPARPDELHGLVGQDGARWVRAEAGTQLLNSTGNEVTRSGNGRDRDWLAPADTAPARPEVFGFNGGSAALRRSALEDVGLLEESLFMYYEDTELSWRLRRRGWSVHHVPTAVTLHDHAGSSGTSTAFFQHHNERNRLLVALVHAPLGVVVRGLARAAVRCVVGPDRRRRARTLAAVAARLPWALTRRAAVDRSATVPRSGVAALLVPDAGRAS
ncbi:MAG: glycosyltransferase family 2 protein [Actinotalea sp.]|nr:glycosyltransferase family 2 protein [Actinotalea sp.]